MGGATTGQKQSAGREYKCDGCFHGVMFCSMCVFGLTKKATADSRREPRQRNGQRQRRLAPASWDNLLPYRLNRIRPAHDKLARVRVNNPSGIICMWYRFDWIGASLYLLN